MSNAAVRPAAVAGRFYPGDADALAQQLATLMPASESAAPAKLLVGPHAGWMYSGAIAAEAWAEVEVPQRVLVMAPNHTGRGARLSVWGGGPWALPGGDVAVDPDLPALLVEHAGMELDTEAHRREHAIEVHLPFARARQPNLRLTAVVLGGLSAAACEQVGAGIAAAIDVLAEDVLVVASTDMSHYVSAEEADVLDHLALDRLLAMDPAGLHDTVVRRRISMCGVIPTAVGLHVARARGATEATLVRYGNSGQTSGDLARVVGYAAAIVR